MYKSSRKLHRRLEKQMQVTNPQKLTSKLELDKIEKHTRSIPGGGYVFKKSKKDRQEEEDYSKYIK